MNIDAKNLKASPFVGVLGILTNDFGFFPNASDKKEIKGLDELLDVKILKGSLAQSSLLGVLGVGLDSKLAVSEIVEKREIREVEKQGIEVAQIPGTTALGNLLSLNQNGGIVSPLLEEKQVSMLSDFFDVKLLQTRIAQNDVSGASIVATSKGFIVHPGVSDEEFSLLRKTFRVEGKATTANYGDKFVGNSVLAKAGAALVGSRTSGVEVAKIDEGLRGE